MLNHLAGTAVPVPGVLASESDPRFFGAPFLLLESIDAAQFRLGGAFRVGHHADDVASRAADAGDVFQRPIWIGGRSDLP